MLDVFCLGHQREVTKGRRSQVPFGAFKCLVYVPNTWTMYGSSDGGVSKGLIRMLYVCCVLLCSAMF